MWVIIIVTLYISLCAERLFFTRCCFCQMIVPLSQLINALHSLKNSATASVQTLHKDFTPDHNSFLKEVRWTPQIHDNFRWFRGSTVHKHVGSNCLHEGVDNLLWHLLTAQCEFEGSWPVRDQSEPAGRAGQQDIAYTRTRGASHCSFDMEDESCFHRQLLSQQAWWARLPSVMVF